MNDQDHQQQLLATYKKNLGILELQIAQHGGENFAPLHLINQLNAAKEQITRISGLLNPSATPPIATKVVALQAQASVAEAFCLALDANPTLDGLAIHLQLRGLRVARTKAGQAFYGQTKFPIAATIIDAELLRTNQLALAAYLEYLNKAQKPRIYILDNNYSFGDLVQLFGDNIAKITLLDPEIMPVQLAKTILSDLLVPILEHWDSQKALDIDIFSYQQAEYTQPALLCIDTRQLGFEPADWAALMQAFYDLRETLNLSLTRRLAVRPMNSRLSVAMAFGAVFSSVANFEVRVAYEQRAKTSYDLQTTEWWRNHNNPNPESLKSINQPTITNPQQEAIACLSVSRNVKFATQEYIEDHQLSQLAFFEYSVTEPGLNAVTTGDEGRFASAIANQFGRLLRTHRDTMSRRKVWHFFYALPVSLAVLVGQELNACTPIQCYEFMNDRSEYIPSCLIRQN